MVQCFHAALVALIMVKSTALQSRAKTSPQPSKRKTHSPYPVRTTQRQMSDLQQQDNSHTNSVSSSDHSLFRETSASNTNSLRDGVKLANSNVILPWIGFGTYKLGKEQARSCTLEALKQGYRCIDTAFIYGGETTETQVGLALQDAISDQTTRRDQVIVTTKHWRKYHGYEPTLACLQLSLKRLQVEYIDVWLMHWPGPAWTTMNRRKDEIAQHGPWHYATHKPEEMPTLRAETWRAMEDAVKCGRVKAIGVSNFTIQHLERLKKTATLWPPAVNQIECHPLYPQTELVEYCQKEGIVVQAYASLGGQDAGKGYWKKLYPIAKPPKQNKKRGSSNNNSNMGGDDGAEADAVPPTVVATTKLWNAPPVVQLTHEINSNYNNNNKTPAQILLRWALEKNLAIVPKTAMTERMVENAQLFDFSLSLEQMTNLEQQLKQAMEKVSLSEEEQEDRNDDQVDPATMGRLCWRNDPLRLLNFD
jgi:diketogulonate reductase-like aldo/keto reductase